MFQLKYSLHISRNLPPQALSPLAHYAHGMGYCKREVYILRKERGRSARSTFGLMILWLWITLLLVATMDRDYSNYLDNRSCFRYCNPIAPQKVYSITNLLPSMTIRNALTTERMCVWGKKQSFISWGVCSIQAGIKLMLHYESIIFFVDLVNKCILLIFISIYSLYNIVVCCVYMCVCVSEFYFCEETSWLRQCL